MWCSHISEQKLPLVPILGLGMLLSQELITPGGPCLGFPIKASHRIVTISSFWGIFWFPCSQEGSSRSAWGWSLLSVTMVPLWPALNPKTCRFTCPIFFGSASGGHLGFEGRGSLPS